MAVEDNAKHIATAIALSIRHPTMMNTIKTKK
jgi:hypothetical protein